MVGLRKASKALAGVATAGIGIFLVALLASRIKRDDDTSDAEPGEAGAPEVAHVNPIYADGEEDVPLREDPVETPAPDVSRQDPRRQPEAPRPAPQAIPPPIAQTMPNGGRRYARDPSGELTAEARASVVAESLRRHGYERRGGKIVKIENPPSYRDARSRQRRSQYHAPPTSPAARDSYYAGSGSYRNRRIEASRRTVGHNARTGRTDPQNVIARTSYSAPRARTVLSGFSGATRTYPTRTTQIRPPTRSTPTRRPSPTSSSRATRYSRSSTRARTTSTRSFAARRKSATVARAAAHGRAQSRAPVRRAVRPKPQKSSKSILAAYNAYRGRR